MLHDLTERVKKIAHDLARPMLFLIVLRAYNGNYFPFGDTSPMLIIYAYCCTQVLCLKNDTIEYLRTYDYICTPDETMTPYHRGLGGVKNISPHPLNTFLLFFTTIKVILY